MATGLFVGLTTIDIFNVVDRFPAANGKVRADRQLISAGGPAANGAVAYAALGNEALLLTGLGGHPVAALASADLAEHGVTLLDRAAEPREPPVISSIIIDSSSGDRCVVYSDTRARRLAPDDRYDHLAGRASVILCDGFYPEQAIAVARARPERVPAVLDGGSWKDGLDELLEHIDYAICSEDFMPPGCSSTDELFAYLRSKGVAGCAVSRGPKPILWEHGRARSETAVPGIDAVDTLGSGDILHGAFCHHITTSSFAASLHRAAITASKSCTWYGTREWIRHL